jgi:flavin reductase (DIM6/NTAB) family NADH-FMN oxidoreductase RutF
MPSVGSLPCSSLLPATEKQSRHGAAKPKIRCGIANIVTFDLAEAMNLTSGEYEASVNEFALAKLTSRPSRMVRPPQVAESPVNFECTAKQILDFSTGDDGGSVVIGEVVSVHVSDAHLKDGKLDRNSLDLIGRMGGLQYTRTTQRFEMVRPKVG